MSADHAALMRNAHAGERARGVLHGVPVRLAAHDHPNERLPGGRNHVSNWIHVRILRARCVSRTRLRRPGKPEHGEFFSRTCNIQVVSSNSPLESPDTEGSPDNPTQLRRVGLVSLQNSRTVAYSLNLHMGAI